MITAVLFDLDETLLDRTSSLASFLVDQYGRFQSELGSPPLKAWLERFIALDKRGSVHKRLVYPAILEEFGGALDAAPALLEDYLAGCHRHARPFDGMHRVLSELRLEGKRIAVVTNGETTFQMRHITALGLPALTDAILVSEAEELRKPDPRLFQRAAERLGFRPQDSLFVGDNPSSDILGAHDAGMQTAWFQCGQIWPTDLRPNPGATIRRLADVLEIAFR
jgi:putative hydrolase of the HAD superfamily